MAKVVKTYVEKLQPGEVDLLKKRAEYGKKSCYKLFARSMPLCFILPFFGAWYSVLGHADNAFSYTRYFGTTVLLLLLSLLLIIGWYLLKFHHIRQDISSCSKTVATMPILRKQYFVRFDAYYFYIGSPVKLFIQVNQYDYFMHMKGDEISIEYGTHSKVYLGYF